MQIEQNSFKEMIKVSKLTRIIAQAFCNHGKLMEMAARSRTCNIMVRAVTLRRVKLVAATNVYRSRHVKLDGYT